MTSARLFSVFSAAALITTLGFSFSTFAAPMTAEIAQLNQDFSGALGYPILIIDTDDFQKSLASKNLAGTQDRNLLIRELTLYSRARGLPMEPRDASQLTSSLNGAASAMPFYTDPARRTQMRYCVVLSSANNASHLDEVKRIIGADGQEDIYAGFDIQKLLPLMSQEDLQLFSLYHELSHCLDRNYLPNIFEDEVVPHNVHLAESFAEVNALILLNQRHGLKKLGAPRSILRTVYSKYYGPAIAHNATNPFLGAVNKAGGSVYFLSPALLGAQQELDRNATQIAALSLEQTLALSKMLVEQHALTKFSFEALNMLIVDGPETILPYYQRLAKKSPAKFLKAYQDVLYYKTMMDSVEGSL
ncbi:hypothetical protein D3C87_1064330 [compost metagenome]